MNAPAKQEIAMVERDDGPDLDPFDSEEIYEAYSEWLCNNRSEIIFNSDSLVNAIEHGVGWDEFLQTRREI